MLPHGTLCTDSPRVTSTARCSTQPKTDSATASRPPARAMAAALAFCRDGGAGGSPVPTGSSVTSGPPAPASTAALAGAATRAPASRRPDAYSTADARIALAEGRMGGPSRGAGSCDRGALTALAAPPQPLYHGHPAGGPGG